jgi:hypothetical protein
MHMKLGLAGALVGGLLASTSAHATLIWEGITYSLTEATTGDPQVYRFTLDISGINAATDLEGGGRSGVNAIAFNLPNPQSGFVSAVMVTPPSGFQLVNGGLNSTGCDIGAANFYCFDNINITYDNDPQTADNLPGSAYAPNTSLQFVFDVTVTPGTLLDAYDPSFKIDWTGFTANGDARHNYSLVSQQLGDTTYVPEPGSIALLGAGLISFGGIMSWRNRRRRQDDDSFGMAA